MRKIKRISVLLCALIAVIVCISSVLAYVIYMNTISLNFSAHITMTGSLLAYETGTYPTTNITTTGFNFGDYSYVSEAKNYTFDVIVSINKSPMSLVWNSTYGTWNSVTHQYENSIFGLKMFCGGVNGAGYKGVLDASQSLGGLTIHNADKVSLTLQLTYITQANEITVTPTLSIFATDATA